MGEMGEGCVNMPTNKLGSLSSLRDFEFVPEG